MQRPNMGSGSFSMLLAASGRGKGAEPAQIRWASDQDFNRHRAAITELYNSNNVTLPHIMEIMERQHGFFAT